MTSFKTDYKIRCWNDCLMQGCPAHEIVVEANNTSNALVYSRDGKVVFGMDFDELAEFILSVNEMRGWVEIENIFRKVELSND